MDIKLANVFDAELSDNDEYYNEIDERLIVQEKNMKHIGMIFIKRNTIYMLMDKTDPWHNWFKQKFYADLLYVVERYETKKIEKIEQGIKNLKLEIKNFKIKN